MRIIIAFLTVIVMLSSCKNRHSVEDINITVIETLQPEEIYPVLKRADFILDSLRGIETLKAGNALSDSITVVTKSRIDSFLRESRRHLLLEKLEPNITNFAFEQLQELTHREFPDSINRYQKNSFIALTSEQDTCWVEGKIKFTGVFPGWWHFMWIPTKIKEKNGMLFKLVVISGNPKTVPIHNDGINNIIVKNAETSFFKKIKNVVTRNITFFWVIELKEDALNELQSQFHLQNSVLLKCVFKNDKGLFYESESVENIMKRKGFIGFIVQNP